jgi:uncharacterized membrane protein
MTRNVLRSIVVNAPPDRAYAIWSDFENFPRFMAPVDRVRMDGRRLHWRAVFEDGPLEWEADIVETTPPRRVAWHAAAGRQQNVVVTIRPIDDTQTEVTIGAEFNADPESRAQHTLRFEEYLRAFKDLVEGTSPADWMSAPDDVPGRFA